VAPAAVDDESDDDWWSLLQRPQILRTHAAPDPGIHRFDQTLIFAMPGRDDLVAHPVLVSAG
jgi:hypothetical protein